MKPKFDPNAEFEVVEQTAQSKPAFDPNLEYEEISDGQSSSNRQPEDMLDVPENKTSVLDAALAGVVQGTTFGFGEEALAGIKSIPTAAQSLLEALKIAKEDGKDLKEEYQKYRDIERERMKLLEEEHPLAYNAGDLTASIGTGLLTGGAGLVGKGLMRVGGKELIKEGLEKGALKGLATLGAAEGAAHGLGRSEADLTEGEVGQAAIDTALGGTLGAAIPVGLNYGGKAIKGTAKFADDVVEELPFVGDVYGHLKGVAKKGYQNLGTSGKDLAQKYQREALDATNEVKDMAVQQRSRFDIDLDNAQVATNRTAFDKTQNFVKESKRLKNEIGETIGAIDDAILKEFQESTSLPNLYTDSSGKLGMGTFNFSSLDDEVKEITEILSPNLQNGFKNVSNNIKSGDYSNYTRQMKSLNNLIDNALDGSGDKRLLVGYKKKLQDQVDNTMVQQLEGNAKNLYKQRLVENKKYSDILNYMDELSAGQGIGNEINTKMSIAANSKAKDATGFQKGPIQKAIKVGDSDLIKSLNESLSAQAESNRFGFDPTLGKMFNKATPEGQNEQMVKLFQEGLGKQNENKTTSLLKNTVNNFGLRKKSSQELEAFDNAIKWIDGSIPDKQQAELLKQKLKTVSEDVDLMKSYLPTKDELNQDVSSYIRIAKKLADPLSYGIGKTAGYAGKALDNVSIAPANRNRSITDTIRALSSPENYTENYFKSKEDEEKERIKRSLTQPIQYEQAVEQFKQSQRQGDSSSE